MSVRISSLALGIASALSGTLPAKAQETSAVESAAPLVDVVSVTKDNMMESIVKDGFHPFDEIYKGVDERELPKK